ncbi:hypothetical protein B0H11DRAFT_2397967 [Mycena galericulata]|nr:hypothetical protein B0H11DRAFT_2397967 [Mycena galericulata]
MKHPKITDKTFRCPREGCRRHIQLKKCSKGNNAELYYLACFNDEHKRYWHFFEPGEAPPPPSTRPHSRQLLPRASSSASSSSQAPGSSTVRKSSSTGLSTPTPACASGPRCKNGRIHKLCTHRMCKRHCLAAGGCLRHVGSDDESEPQVLVSTATRDLDFSDFEAYAQLLPKQWEAAALASLRAERQRIHALALATPLPPSPTLSEDLEYASLIAPDSASALSSPSSGAPSSSLAVSGSVLPTANFLDLILFYWLTNGCATIQALYDPSIRGTHISLRDISHFIITDEYPELETHYQCFSMDYTAWMKIGVDYPIKIHTERPLYIRRMGVIGSDEHVHLPRLSVPDPSSPSTQPRPAKQTCSKGKGRAIEVPDSSDDDVLIVSYKRAIKQEKMTPPRETKRRRLSVTVLTTSPSPPALLPSAVSTTTPALPSVGSSPSFPLAILSPRAKPVRRR